MAFADDVAARLEQTVPSLAVIDAAAATERWIARQRPDLADPLAEPDVREGMIRMAHRLVSRDQTPVGAAPGYDGQSGTPIAYSDPDIQRLCGIGRARKPGGLG